MAQLLIQALPGGAAVLTAIAAAITAVGAVRAGRTAIDAKEEQVKVKQEQIQLLERLTPMRIVEYLDGFKASFERLLEQARSQLAEAEANIAKLEKSNAASESERDRLLTEQRDLQRTINDLLAKTAAVELTAQATRDIDSLDELPPQEFEDLVRQLFERQGYRVTSAAGSDSGSGFDFWASDSQGFAFAVETMRFRRPIGAAAIRELYARRALSKRPIHRAVLVTTGSFTKQALEAARPGEIQLVDGAEFRVLLEKYGLGGLCDFSA
jgi:HJR/Mrr/RecB family endonuclease